jgi:hypothetical protein
MIFAREISAPLTSLVKKLDEATDKNSKAKMGSFVVFLGDEGDLEKQVKSLADKESIKKTILSTMSTQSGPEKYKVAKDASITVVLYNKRKVEANYAFEKGKMSDKDVEQIVGDLSKILPKDKKDKDK